MQARDSKQIPTYSEERGKDNRMNRKKMTLLAGIVMMIAVTAWAQDSPKAEVAIDYSYIHFVPAKASGSANLNGGGVQLTYNFGRCVGIKADFQGYGSTNRNFTVNNLLGIPTTVNANADMFTYLFGPQIKKHGRIEPFAEALFGGAHSNTYANIFKSGFFVGGTSPSNNAFAMALGGGLDFKVTHKIAIRLGEFDYLLTRFNNPVTQNNNNQNNFRYNAGVVFQF